MHEIFDFADSDSYSNSKRLLYLFLQTDLWHIKRVFFPAFPNLELFTIVNCYV